MAKPVFCFLLLAAAAFGTTSAAQEPVVSNGGGLSLTAEEYRSFAEYIMTDDERARFLEDDEALRELVLDIHSNRVLWRAAEEAGLADRPDVAARLARGRQAVLVDALMAAAVEDIQYPEFEQLARQRYDADPQAYRFPERRMAAHILIRASRSCGQCASAERVLERLRAGEEFSKIAAELSDDRASAQNGGLIDKWVKPDGRVFIPAFEDALFALNEAGDISEPVRTRFGTHIIRLAGREKGRQPTFEEVKPSIIDRLRREYRQSILRAKRGESYPNPRTIDLEPLREVIREHHNPETVSEAN